MRQVIDRLDYTTRDYEGFRTLMIDKLKELMPEYTDIRQSDAGIVILELNAMCLDILSYYIDSIANECFLVTAEQRSNILKFCKMLGYTPRYATSSHYKQVFVKSNADTEITIPAGTKVKTYSSNQDNIIYFTTTEDLVIPRGYLGDEKDPDTGEYLFFVDIIHGIYVRNEVLSTKTLGTANQTYSLNYSPALIDSTFKVYVTDKVSGSEMWSRVSTFAGSNSSSKVYMIENNDYNETSIIFGNGSFGKIPTDAEITCSYYIGGGDNGNVGIGAINTMEDNIAGINSTVNVEQTEYGYDRETIDEIKINAPVAHRNIWGALTTNDYSGVVKTYFPDVKDAEAKKATEDWTVPEVDDIIIYLLTNHEIKIQSEEDFFHEIPESFYNEDLYTGVTTKIMDFFNSDVDYVDIEGGLLDTGRKLSGTRNIILSKPNFAEVTLSYTLMARSYYNVKEISKQVEAYLKRYFSLGNIAFGEYTSFQDIVYDIIDNSGIEGIRYLNIDISGEKDEKGEIHNDLFDYINKDLIIPHIGAIIVLKDLEATLQSSPNSTTGGVTNGR